MAKSFVLVGVTKTRTNSGKREFHIKGAEEFSTLEAAQATANNKMVADPNCEEIFVAEIVGRVYRQAPPLAWQDLV